MTLGGLETEARASALADLDQRPTVEVVDAVVGGHDEVLGAVKRAAPAIAQLAEAVAGQLQKGGRMIYVGAGSAGRLAAVDASEWGPTFSWPDGRVVALVAGIEHPPGSAAEARVEDDATAGAADVAALRPRAEDVIVAVSASGRTPYALGGLEAAGEALTGAITCNAGSPLGDRARLEVVTHVGPEVLAGGTRIKAGTAQKLVLNALSTAVNVRLGRTLGDLMTSMRVANDKLRDRAARICMAAAHCREADARDALARAGDDIPVAIVMLAKGVEPAEARAILEAKGTLRNALV
jgi:N-acetylmuramic acid 6-phosphate etherase